MKWTENERCEVGLIPGPLAFGKARLTDRRAGR